jgi:type II secretory pathway pseudopilin PulG
MNTKNKAFTLVEILVTIGIIFILANLAVWGLSKANRYTKNMSCIKNLKELQLITLLYFQEHHSLPESSLLLSQLTSGKAEISTKCPAIPSSSAQASYAVVKATLEEINSSGIFMQAGGNDRLLFYCDPFIKSHGPCANGILDSGKCIQLIGQDPEFVPITPANCMGLEPSRPSGSSEPSDKTIISKGNPYWIIYISEKSRFQLTK